MASRRNDRTGREQNTDSIVSTAVGAAEALSVGVLHLTERTLVEALHAVEDIGNELGSAVVRAARGSIKAAEEIGGDLVEVGKGVSRGVAEPARRAGRRRRAPGHEPVERNHRGGRRDPGPRSAGAGEGRLETHPAPPGRLTRDPGRTCDGARGAVRRVVERPLRPSGREAHGAAPHTQAR